MAGPIDSKNHPPKTISLKKAIKIIELLCKVKYPYWVMSPIIPQCVEYASKLPWEHTSIAKLLNIILYVSFYEDIQHRESISTATSGHTRHSFLNNSNINSGGLRNSISLPAIHSTAAAAAAAGHSSSSTRIQTNNVSFQLPSEQQAYAIINATAAAFTSASHNNNTTSTNTTANNSQQSSPQHPRRRTSSADISEHMQFGSSKIVMLRNIEQFISKIWVSNVNKNLSQNPEENKDGIKYFIKSLDKHRYSSYIQLNFDIAYNLAEPQHNILLSELAYICNYCWDIEFLTIKNMLNRGQTTFGRRAAIVGSYDTSKAYMNGIERLCLIRLLHWYSTENNFLGIDWEDVEINAKDRLFPFTIPSTLLEKSHNELNYLKNK